MLKLKKRVFLNTFIMLMIGSLLFSCQVSAHPGSWLDHSNGNLPDKKLSERISTPPEVQHLLRTPNIVHSWQAVLVFACISGTFTEMNLSTTVTLDLLIDGSSVIARSKTGELPMTPVPWSPGWYITSIPGLPAKTVEGILHTWKVSSNVSYTLLVDGVEAASGNYTVREHEVESMPPLVTASVYDVRHDQDLLKETVGLGPTGWKIGADENLKTLIVAMDGEGVEDVTFEYSVNGGTWKTVTPAPDTRMEVIDELISRVNKIIDAINDIPGSPLNLPYLSLSIKIYDAQIPGQPAGRYVMFRANATDTDGNDATSPSGFYYVVNETSSTRVLIVDPHVKLWLLQENLKQLSSSLRKRSEYQVPSDILGNMTLLNKIADVIKNHGVTPFHHWEHLGEKYNLHIAWPDETVADLLAQDGFDPDVIVLSDLWLGFGKGRWNWDLEDVDVEGKSLQKHLIDYVKEHHAGLIATHGTLSDWVVWAGCSSEQHFKVGSKGHVGETLEDLNPVNETTVAGLLGMPELALWEFAKDKVAEALCTDPYTKPVGLAVGSMPLQVPNVPLNKSMKVTIEGEGHPILNGLPQSFDVNIPSIYNEFGFKASTQVGWQLAMPRSLAYTAWWKANETRPQATQILHKLAGLIENVTNNRVPSANKSRILDSLEWGLLQFYKSIISANITDGNFTLTVNLPGLDEPKTLSWQINYQKLLQLLPVKLIALSENGLAGIVAHDKYWDENGYRATFLSFEAEASNSNIARTLLQNAVEWTKNWTYKPITQLLGQVRVPQELAERFNARFDVTPGDLKYSDSVLLVEGGQTVVPVDVSNPGFLHSLVAHPTSDKVNVTVTEGQAEISTMNSTGGITEVTVRVYEAGEVNLGIKADPDRSLNPAYIMVKEEADVTSPSIGVPSQEPETVNPDQQVTVSVNVTDEQTGVRKVILSYSIEEGVSWTNSTMIKQAGDAYEGTIEGFPAGTNVTYMIIAYDYADNVAVKPEQGYYVTTYNLAPTANFTYSPTEPTIGEYIGFTDASTDPDGELTSWSWDFGDEYTSTARNPTHKYETPGTYSVTLTVTDDEGATDTISQTITIKGVPFYTEPWFFIVVGVVIIVVIATAVLAWRKKEPTRLGRIFHKR